jgi:hypothetical protein
MSQEEMMRQRYGPNFSGGGERGRYDGGTKFPQPYVAPVVAAPPAPRGGGGLPIVVDEKQLKVTLQLVVVKLVNSNLVAAK